MEPVSVKTPLLKYTGPANEQEIGVLRETATTRRRLIKAGSCCCAPLTVVPCALAAACGTAYGLSGGRGFEKFPCEPTYKTKCSLIFCSILNTYQCCEGGEDTIYLLPHERQRLGLPPERQSMKLNGYYTEI